MRVLVLSSTFPSVNQPTRGVFVRERIRRLAKRCEVVVAAPVPWFPMNRWIRKERATVPFLEHQDGLTVYHPRFFSLPRYGKWLDGVLYFLCLIRFVARLRREFPFEVIDAHFAFPDGLAATLLAKVFGCRVVVTLRGSIVRLSGYRLHRPQLRWVLRHADRVTAVSESLKGVAEGLGVPPGRVRVIPNGVDPKVFSAMDRQEARRLCGLPENARVLLTVGGVYPGKGQHTVVDLLPSLMARYPETLYVMVGKPRPGETYERRLREAVGKLGLDGHVLFAGPRPHAELRRWFSAADVSVLATQSEGWPNVLLESIACGTPVVATHVGGAPEIVRHGKDGFLVPYGATAALRDALLMAMEQPWDREALVRYAQRFDWSESVDQALAELEAALKGSP
jgi:teichuronic acid biosynthesis glycosyltransferase TuaC